jgi:Flp pilus assembly pilin Flp
MHRLSIQIAKARIRAFLSDLSGVAAVEFAYLAPLLMLMTFGTFEMSRALMVHKRFQRATSMVGDLVAREDKLWLTADGDVNNPPSNSVAKANSKDALAGILLAAVHSMEPYSADPLKIRIYQLWANMNDPTKTKIEWSYSYPGGATDGCGDSQSMPGGGMITGNGRAIVVSATYNYTPLLTNIIPGFVHKATWSDTMTFAPRNVPTVEFLPALNNNATWDNPSKTPCQ